MPRRPSTRLAARLRVAAPVLLALTVLMTGGCRGSEASTEPSRGGARAPQVFEVSLLEAKGESEGPAPIALTASDGAGLRLSKLSVQTSVTDPLALTEVRLTFENPEARIIEGTFKIVLPPKASVSRFAMKIGEAWQEGEVVEKQAARQAYEDFLHRRQDPALLEQAPGNEFTARVFPIPARGAKEILITYAQTVGAREPLTFPLRGLPKLDELNVAVFAEGLNAPVVKAERRAFMPGNDLTITSDVFSVKGGARSGDLALLRVVPLPAEQAKTEPETWRGVIFLVDTSASRALGLKEQVTALREIVQRLPAQTHVSVLAFDQTTESVFDGPREGFGEREVAQLIARGAMGASNFEQALLAANDLARSRRDGPERLIVLTDGVVTAGEHDAKRLLGKVEALRSSTIQRIDAVAVGGLRDASRLEQIVQGQVLRDGLVLDPKLGYDEVTRRLSVRAKSRIPVRVEGATWTYPERIDGAIPGEEYLVFAQLPASAPLRVQVGDAPPFEPNVRMTPRPLLERAWAEAKIRSLELSPPEGNEDLARREIISLSTRHRVLSAHTALLVLETDDDYARFRIDRKAKLDVLTVENGRVAVSHVSRMGLVAKEAPLDEESEGESNAERKSRNRADRWAPNGSPRGGNGEGRDGLRLDLPSQPSGDSPTRPRRELAQDVDTVPQTAAPTTQGRLGAASGANQEPQRGPAPPPPAEVVQPTVPPATTPAPHAAASALPGHLRPDPRPVDPADRGGGGQSAPLYLRNGSTSGGEPPVAPYTGRFRSVMDAIKAGKKDQALREASDWQNGAPADEMSLIALGEAREAHGDKFGAARAYGSILELFSFRADSRRFAGERLERLSTPLANALAIDAYRGAVEQRPDHPASHRLLAFALVREGRFEDAFQVLENGVKYKFPEGRFRGVQRILEEDLGLLAAAWIKAEPQRRAEIETRLARAGGTSENEPSLRFVLNWETDANDVDFHIQDGAGNHAYYGTPQLPGGGGALYADVTTGYGPECFTIRKGTRAYAYPYKLSAHYFSRGPMGYGMGKLQIIEHDGKGTLRFQERPFVIMADHAAVDLGTVTGPLKG